jgi:hypothetical protein
MEPFSRPLLTLLACASLLGCQAKIPGNYELDFEETKREVLKTAEANPAERERQKDVLAMLQATRLTVRLLEGGKMETATVLTDKSADTPPPRSGWWKQDGKKVVMAIHNTDPDAAAHGKDPDTSCDVDGKRLRCFKPMSQKLFENYVLVRKD